MSRNAKEENLPNENGDTRADVLQARDVAVAEGCPELVDELP
jgi:hypothetical protein